MTWIQDLAVHRNAMTLGYVPVLWWLSVLSAARGVCSGLRRPAASPLLRWPRWRGGGGHLGTAWSGGRHGADAGRAARAAGHNEPSPKDMDENESQQSLMTNSQYPKEAVRKHNNSARNSGGSDSSRFSRKSFRLDYRLEEDVTKSKKGKDGRFVNPWPTWKNLSIPNVLRWLIMEKDHSSVPSSKEVAFDFFWVLCIDS